MVRNIASRSRAGIASLAILASAPVAVEAATPPAGSPGPTLSTSGQRQLNGATIAILRDPAVRAARDTVRAHWAALPQAALPDGKAHLDGAVDELAQFAAEVAVQRTLFPGTIAWIAAPPFAAGVPGTRSGLDDPDRIYRLVAVDPSRSYVIEGQRAATPSNDDFRFEASADSLRTLGGLDARDIDVTPDGRFRVVLDAKPAATGERNHLTLPPGTNAVLIRDTVADWNRQLPNRLTFRQADGGEPARGTPAQARDLAVSLIAKNDAVVTKILADIWKQPDNQFVAKVRTLKDGLPGYIFAGGHFALRPGEALAVTLDPQTARYVGFELTDPWSRSLPYWKSLGSLSDRQVTRNPDGSLTLIVAGRDPGVANWVDTHGLTQGIVGIRIENMPQPSTIDVAKVVREARVVPAAAIAESESKVSPAARGRQLADREAGFLKRVRE